MEVQKEAQRIMTLSVWKMYHSRLQRGGLRLHRSLQLSLVMRSARELYLSAKVDAPEPELCPNPAGSPDPRLLPSPREAEAPAEAAPPDGEPPSPEPMDTQEEAPRAAETPVRGDPRPARVSRKRRSSSLSDCGDAGLVPSKKARLDSGEEEGKAAAVPDRLQPPPAHAEGAFPNLARVLQRRFSGLLNCSPAASPTAPPACEAPPACRPADSMLNVLVRAVVAF
ncbi:immediate early response gene 2 protein [Dipodomys spectabilis]|uniref:immediate early response gene 2 protein n=1 Tax=Dipodomys spectabilis TaxID=105255 RepID=UPI001C54135A|nr:immediate early response gene 2 protein [Dipodomys spectabilis]